MITNNLNIYIPPAPSPSNSNEDEDNAYSRCRHLNIIRRILALRIKSTKVALAAPFDQAVPGSYSVTEAALPHSAVATPPKAKRIPEVIRRHLRSVNGFRDGLKQDQGYVAGTPSPIRKAMKSVNDQDKEGSATFDSHPNTADNTSCSSPLQQRSHKFTNTNSSNGEPVSRMTTKYLSYSFNSYTAQSSALVHLSQADFVAELFKFGEGSKLLTSCSVLEDKTEDESKLDVVVACPSEERVRYSLLDMDTLNTENPSINEGDSVVAYYDVGKETATVRAEESKSRGFFIVSSRPHGCCQVTLTAEVQVSTLALNITKIIKSAIIIVRTAYDVFYRGEEVDEAIAEAFINSLASAPELTSQETHSLSKNIKILTEGTFKRVWTGESSIDAYEVFTKNDAHMGKVNKCVATLHTSAERLLSQRNAYDSNANMKHNKSHNKDLQRYGHDVPDSHSKLVGGSIFFFPGFSNRRFNQVFTWAKIENYQNRGNVAYVMVIHPQIEFILPNETEPNLPPLAKGLIQGIMRGFTSFEALTPNISRLTLIQWTDFGGLPRHIANYIKGYTIAFVKVLQHKYARKKAVVDAERRDHFASRLKAVQSNALNEEQLEIIATAQALEQEYMDSPVVNTKIHSISCLVPMEMKIVPSKNGERSVATGQASSVFDVSAEIAIAQIVRYSSREGHPTQFQIEERGLFDSIFVYNRQMPKPLRPREFLFRVITHKRNAAHAKDGSSSSSYSVAVVSTPAGFVDYGIKVNTVRARMVTCYTATPIGNNDQCRVVTTQKIDAGGFIPSFGTIELGHALRMLHQIRLILHRDSEVDRLERRLVTGAMEKYCVEDREMMYTEDDKVLVARVAKRFSQLSKNGVKVDVLTSDALVDTASFLARDGSVSLLSEFVVDSSVEEVAAFVFCLKSRFQSEAHHKEGENIEINKVSPHRQIFKSIINFKTKEIGYNYPLEFKSTMAWKRGEGEGEYYIVSEPLTDHHPLPLLATSFISKARRISRMPSFNLPLYKVSQVLPLAMVRAGSSAIQYNERQASIRVAECKSWSYMRLERMVGVGDGEGDGEGVEGKQQIPQTSVKFYSQLRLDASIQMSNANSLSRRQHIASAVRLRKYFDRSVELDQVARNQFVAAMSGANGAGEYSVEEDALIAQGVKRLEDFEVNAKKQVFLSPLSIDHIGTAKGETKNSALSVTTVKAPPLQILAFLWNYSARNVAKIDTINKQVVEEANIHHKIVYMEKVTKFSAIKNRSFLVRFLWKEIAAANTTAGNFVNDKKKVFVFVVDSVEHESYPIGRSNAPIRALYMSAIKLTQLSERETKSEYMVRLGHGNAVDKLLVTKKLMTIYLKYNLQRTVRLQQYFRGLVKLDDLDEKDGIKIGETLFLCRSTEFSAVKVFRQHVALVELNEEYDFFEPMMIHITGINLSSFLNLFSSSSLGTPHKRTKLDVLGKNDGKKLAKFLRQMILTSANQGVAVERFQESIAMRNFFKTRPFVRSMISTLCDRIITERTLDKAFQSVKKAAYSLADVASDAFITIVYLREDGGRDTAYALLVIISASLFMQLGLCIINHYSNWRIMLREMLYTVLFVRGGVLHMRMLTQQAADGHVVIFERMNESNLYRLIEIIFESMPGAYIQLSAILTEGGSISVLKYLSLAISIVIVSVSVSNVDYRKDSDMKNRSQLHHFYGFIPGQGVRKFVVVSLMHALCFTQFCIRIGFFCLMGTRSITFLLIFMLGEFTVYLAVKFVRSDLTYWLPLTGIASDVLGFVIRFAGFELTVASSLLQGRHPYESGGVGWIVCHIVTHAELLCISFNLYFPAVTWTASDIQTISVLLVGTWWVTFSLMLFFGEAKYRSTFFSLKTASQYQKFIFETGGDETRAKFFGVNAILWEGFKNEIEEWLGDNWERWEHESATKDNPFFTEYWKLRVQDLNVIPDGIGKIYDGNVKVASSEG